MSRESSVTSKFFFNLSEYKAFITFFTRYARALKVQYTYLHLKGIGFKLYRSTLPPAIIVNAGYNHYTKFKLPKFSTVFVRKAYLIFCSNIIRHAYYVNYIRSIRFPDPYRAKGFRFKNQIIKFKIGKQR